MGKKKSLLIGITDYQNSPLNGCLNDIRLMYKIFKDIYGYSDFRVLDNKAATKKNILKGNIQVFGIKDSSKENGYKLKGQFTISSRRNIMLLILNLPVIPLWVKLLRMPYRYLFPLILIFCIIGAYSIGNSVMDIVIMLFFGALGYVFRKIEYEGAPFVLGVILGPLFEKTFTQSLIMANGNFTIFFRRPISLSIFILLAVFTIIPLAINLKTRLAESGFDDE